MSGNYPRNSAKARILNGCMTNYNCPTIVNLFGTHRLLGVVYADASDTGYGGHVVEHGDCVAYGQWTEHEAQQSSTWR